MIPEFLDRPGVLGIGEIGLNKNTRNEATVFLEHLDLAVRTDEQILIHTPHLEDKYQGTRMILDMLCDDERIHRERVLVDHVEEHTVRLVLDEGFWAGMTLYPVSKCTPAPGGRRCGNVRARATAGEFGRATGGLRSRRRCPISFLRCAGGDTRRVLFAALCMRTRLSSSARAGTLCSIRRMWRRRRLFESDDQRRDYSTANCLRTMSATSMSASWPPRKTPALR